MRNRTTVNAAIDHLESFRDERAVTSHRRPYGQTLAAISALQAAGQTTVVALWIVCAMGALPATGGDPPLFLTISLVATLAIIVAGVLRRGYLALRGWLRHRTSLGTPPPTPLLEASVRVLRRVRSVVPGNSPVSIVWRPIDDDDEEADDRARRLELRVDGGMRGLMEFSLQMRGDEVDAQAELASQVLPIRFRRSARFPGGEGQDRSVGRWVGSWLADQPGLAAPTVSPQTAPAIPGRVEEKRLVEVVVPEFRHDAPTARSRVVSLYLLLACPLMIPALLIFGSMQNWQWQYGGFVDWVHESPHFVFVLLALGALAIFWPRDVRSWRTAGDERQAELTITESSIALDDVQVRLEEPFSVQLYRTHDEDLHQSIGVEIRGRGAAQPLRFRFASPGSASLSHLEVMDFSAPRFDADEVLREVWPTLVTAAQLHGTATADWSSLPDVVRRSASPKSHGQNTGASTHVTRTVAPHLSSVDAT